MDAVFYAIDIGKDEIFQECIQDPLTDVGGNWLLPDIPPSQSSGLTRVPDSSRNAGSCNTEFQDDSAQVGRP